MNEEFKAFEAGWPGEDTVCGWGSKMEHTNNIRQVLPKIIRDYEIKSINDAGCGDLHWIKNIDFGKLGVYYRGYDLYPRDSWKQLNEVWRDGGPVWRMMIADVTTDVLPKADLAICRDVMIHLPNYAVQDVLENLKASHKYLLATNFVCPPAIDNMEHYAFSNFERIQHVSMHHSKLDLRLPPFNLGNPLRVITEDYPYKSIALWKL